MNEMERNSQPIESLSPETSDKNMKKNHSAKGSVIVPDARGPFGLFKFGFWVFRNHPWESALIVFQLLLAVALGIIVGRFTA